MACWVQSVDITVHIKQEELENLRKNIKEEKKYLVQQLTVFEQATELKDNNSKVLKEVWIWVWCQYKTDLMKWVLPFDPDLKIVT